MARKSTINTVKFGNVLKMAYKNYIVHSTVNGIKSEEFPEDY